MIKRMHSGGVAVDVLYLENLNGGTTAFLLTSSDFDSTLRHPAVMLLHGHDSHAVDFIEPSHASRIWPLGVEMARNGFVVLIPEIRYETSDLKGEVRQAFQLLLQGRTLMGERVADAMRCVNFLSKHPKVNPANIGVLGWSMGGHIALYAAALDHRIKAIYLSASAGAMRLFVLPEAPLETGDNYIPYLLSDFGDKDKLLSMVFPRPLFIEHGYNDNTNPLGAVMVALETVRPLYESRHLGDRLQLFEHGRGHYLEGSKAVMWFRRWLQNLETPPKW